MDEEQRPNDYPQYNDQPDDYSNYANDYEDQTQSDTFPDYEDQQIVVEDVHTKIEEEPITQVLCLYVYI